MILEQITHTQFMDFVNLEIVLEITRNMKYEPKTQMKAALKVSKQTRGYLIGEKKKENSSGKWR